MTLCQKNIIHEHYLTRALKAILEFLIGTTCAVSAVSVDFTFPANLLDIELITDTKTTLKSSIRQARSNIFGSL